jgi:signal recognition particle receptor subunit beta
MTTLYVYIAGPHGSGKTTFLRSLGNPNGFTVDAANGIEYRQFVVDETLDLQVMAPIEASRFDHLLEIAQRDMLGYIVLVDSADQETWSMARIMLAHLRGYALVPTLIVANKQDLLGAATPEQVGAWIGIESMVYVTGCQANKPKSVRDAFLQLLFSVRHEIERLDALIAELERTFGSDDAP